MKNLVRKLNEQLKDAQQIAQGIKADSSKSFSNIVISGLGGSGIGGSITKDLLFDLSKLPIVLNRGYALPNFVDEHSLVIISSFSGNTEETLIALQQAIEKKATIFCISSGGKVIDLAKKHQLNFVQLPTAFSPRAMLSYSLTQLVYALKAYGVFEANLDNIWEGIIQSIETNTASIQKEAKMLADFFYKKTPILYCVDGFNGVSERFRQQINENSKMLGWHQTVPEMNHNELVGWTTSQDHKDKSVLFMTNPSDYERNRTRIELNQEIISNYAETKKIESKGANNFEQSFYWIHLGDWTSVYLSELNGVDVMEVKVIDYLKSELGKS